MEDVNNSLICAIRNGDMVQARTLIESYGLSYSDAWSQGYILLRDAVENDQSEIAKLIVDTLLERNAEINARNVDGSSPLHIAVEKGQENFVKLLLNCGADVSIQDLDGRTALFVAIEKRNENLVKVLLEGGADVNIQDRRGRSVLYVAAATKDAIIVRSILEFCPDVSSKSNRAALHLAVRERCGSIVEYLLKYGFNIDREDVNEYELLDTAVTEGYLGIVERLLEYGTDVDKLAYLHKATAGGIEGAVSLLLNYGADVNYRDHCGRTAIFFAARNANLKLFCRLLANSDLSISDHHEVSLLHYAAQRLSYPQPSDANHARAEISKMLLSRGANVNAQDNFKGYTPLHIAVIYEDIQVIKVLLEHNADIDSANHLNEMPLHLSAGRGNEVITEMLLDNGANVNAKQTDGLTPLHNATEGRHKNVVELLLERGAHVDCITKNNLPLLLHCAGDERCVGIIKAMLKFGADINSRDQDGSTALHIASEYGNSENVLTLLEYGADINITNKDNKTPIDAVYSVIVIQSIDEYMDLNYYDPFEYGTDEHLEDCEDRHLSTSLILERHIVKMTTAGLYVSHENVHSMNTYSSKMSTFEDACEKEIKTMTEKIPNTNISFHDILSKGINQLIVYMRNEHIMRLLEPYYIGKKFPVYSSMLQDLVRRALERKSLLEQGDRVFAFLCNNDPGLPLQCTERIFSYLSNKELKNVIEAGESII